MRGTLPTPRVAFGSRPPRTAVAAVLLLAASAAQALPAVQAVSPFDVTGLLQAATLDGSGQLAGGTVTVNNQLIIVPKNLLVQLPATFLTWTELFQLAPAPYGPTQTGMALTDSPTPLGSYEVHVQGNRVGDQYIAGLVTISQLLLATGQGYINYIDYGRGEVRVGGTIGSATTGQRVKLNDPIGRFGPRWSPDVRFTIDEANPTVRATTGYPMCVPRFDPASRTDPECPQTNRPRDPSTGGYVSIFTMPDPAITQAPDATKQAPFEIGDYVTYSGVLITDGTQPTVGPAPPSGTLVAAYLLIANVAIFTWPGADPAYLAVDVAILGVGGTPIAGVPQEATVRTRFEGFSTDPSRIVVLFGVDADPCTGVMSDRDWGMVAVDPGPPVGAVLGRWRFRPPTKILAMPSAGVFLPATRTVRAVMVGTPMTVANGLVSGQYEAPIADYLFPENLAVGGPQVPLNFQEFPFLANGSGPWPGGGPNPIYAGIVGQLSPWPGQPAPTAPSCSTGTLQPPVADAGPGQTVVSGTTVALDGSASYDPNGLPITYAWTQTSGPSVKLSSVSAVRPTFAAPAVTGSQILTFQLVVKDSGGASAPATVSIAVQAPSLTTLPPVADAGAAQTVASGASVQLNGSASFDPNNPPLVLSYTWTQTGGPSTVLTGATTPFPTFTAPIASPGTSTLLTYQLLVRNSAGFGATAQVNVTVNPATAPTANAGVPQTVLTNSTVTLDGSGSFDPNGLPLTYSWSQIAGPTVAITATPGSPTATFKAPPIGALSLLFTLVVNDGVLSSTPAQTSVSVQNQPDIVTILSAVYKINKQRLVVTATSNANAQLWLKGINGGPDVQMVLTNGVPTATLTGVPNPGFVTVFSNLGGSATGPVTAVRN